jgi:hypothetical protein
LGEMSVIHLTGAVREPPLRNVLAWEQLQIYEGGVERNEGTSLFLVSKSDLLELSFRL